MQQTIWAAHETVGIKFEMGNNLEENRGEYHFWVSTSHWWLEQGSNREFEDIVHSESSLFNIDKKIAILNGKKLIDVEYYKEHNGIVFVFDDDLFLRVSPHAGKVRDLFQLFTKDEIVSVQSDGTYRTEAV
ncbi:MAG: hypothetical protein M3Q81_04530 [bacterium]|nr:hypothetical protein [bacterium]